MKIFNNNTFKALFAALIFSVAFTSCEREISDAAEFATMDKTAEIFTDTFVGLGADFFFPYADAKAEVFGVDAMGYESASSIRIDVPNADDPAGAYAGAIFRIDGDGRNLTEYDALTFYAKASQGVHIGEIGFGEDFVLNKYIVTASNVSLGTNWQKYIIPIPDASFLTNERGMLRFAAGTQETNSLGYTFWLDEIKFEKLGTLSLPMPKILNGEDVVMDSFNGVTTQINGLTVTYNLGNGAYQTVSAAPAYYQFSSSNPAVAIVNESGVVTVLAEGTAVITAQMNGVLADGSLTINSLGDFDSAPTPTTPAENVISIFSDAYANVPVAYYNGYFAPYQTTQGGAVNVAGDNIISYTNLNFVAVGTLNNVSPVNATDMTHIHVDINVQEALDADDFIRFQLHNDVGGNETSGKYTIDGSQLASQQWRSFDIPLSSFDGLGDRSQLGLYFFISDGTIASMFVDNLYLYKQ